MATNVTLIKNTLVNKYFAYDGGNVAVHEFPTQNAGELRISNRIPVCLVFYSYLAHNFQAGKRTDCFLCSQCIVSMRYIDPMNRQGEKERLTSAPILCRITLQRIISYSC